MSRLKSRVRKPVAREGNEYYIRLTLVSFALTVSLTRLFLQMTGYPQFGSHTLHIAHLLWGGLLLVIAALLMLIFANRWVYTVGALLLGVGVGLFIDEVGKFITQTNDYFYPPAAPIIYVFFLMIVLLYFGLRRPPPRDARSELYRAFDALQEVLDRDLDAQERTALTQRLSLIVGSSEHPDLVRLAQELLIFLNSDALQIAPHSPDLWERLVNGLQSAVGRRLTQRRLKALLVLGLVVLGVLALAGLGQFLLAFIFPERYQALLAQLITIARLSGVNGLTWFTARTVLDGTAGILLLVAAGLLAFRRDEHAFRFGYLGLLLSLTIVDLMVFYLDQFSAIVPAAVQFFLLVAMLHYHQGYLDAAQGQTPKVAPVDRERPRRTPHGERKDEGAAGR
jgi:hypothetical protein